MLGDVEKVPKSCLVKLYCAVDFDYCSEELFIAIVLVWRDVGQSHVGPIIDFDHETVAFHFVDDCNFELKFSAHHDDWPHAILVEFLALDSCTVLAQLHFGELGSFIVGDEQIHEFAFDNEGELHIGIGSCHV